MGKRVFRHLLYSTIVISCVLFSCTTSNPPQSDSSSCDHHFITEEGTTPTCTEKGFTDKVYCDLCGFVEKEHEEISPTGHHLVHIPAKEPGLSFEGQTEKIVCDYCNTVFQSSESINKLEAKDDIYSVTLPNNSCDFTFVVHRQDLKYKTNITVIHGDIIEDFELENENHFIYSNMTPDTIYSFIVNTEYEDGDHESSKIITRYINTQAPSLPSIDIETKDYEWPSSIRIQAPEGLWGEGQKNNDYVNCYFTLKDKDGNLLYQSSTEESTKYDKSRIKKRGNTTSYCEKPSYKLKLDKKADLLKNFFTRTDKEYKDKEWLLLNNNDISTQVGFIANSLIAHNDSLSGTYVSVTMNGDYRGVYYLCESIKQGNGEGASQSRVNVSDSGFIIEDDAYWWNEDIYFDTILINNPTKFTFKYPSVESFEDSNITYIKNCLTEFEEALLLSGDEYLNHIDVESFASWLLIHDILGTDDAGGSNIYLTKYDNQDSNIKMGPCWDFDSILQTYVNHHSAIYYSMHFYYGRLINKESFNEEFKNQFNSIKTTIINDLLDAISLLDLESIDKDYSLNDIRWQSRHTSSSDYIEKLVNYLTARINFLDYEVN